MQLDSILSMVAHPETQWEKILTADGEVSVCSSDVSLRIERTNVEDEFFHKIEAGSKEPDNREEWLRKSSAPYYSLRNTRYVAFYGSSPVFSCDLVSVDGGRAIMPWPTLDRDGKPTGFNPHERGMAGAVGGWNALRSYAEKAGIPWEVEKVILSSR